jgi:hypothetical protein
VPGQCLCVLLCMLSCYLVILVSPCIVYGCSRLKGQALSAVDGPVPGR